MFDWPPPTGFSYCDGDDQGDGFSCGDWDDTRQAQISYAALDGFYKKFSHVEGRPLCYSTQSYFLLLTSTF